MHLCVSARRDGGLAPAAQLVLTASWLTMKEASLLAGTLAASLPTSSEQNATACWTCPLMSMHVHAAMPTHNDTQRQQCSTLTPMPAV